MIITSIANQKKTTPHTKETLRKVENLFEMLEMTCHICAHPYNSSDLTPISVCPQQHTYCAKCVTELFVRKPYATRCPTCRAFIRQTETKVNKTVLRLCDVVPTVGIKIDSLEHEKKELEKKLVVFAS